MIATILVIDDLDTNIKLLEAKLSSEYYNVYTANSANEAFKILEQNKIDLILLDVMMPDIDGITACKTIKANPKTSYIPIIMVTALTDIEDRIRGLEAGADEFLTKPINDLSLFARVKSLTRTKSLLDELKLRNHTNKVLGIDDIPINDDLSNSNIVIFDDDIIQSKNIYNVLKNFVNNVNHFNNYTDFNNYINSFIPDLVLISCQIDNIDSLRVCVNLKTKENFNHVSIILMAEEDMTQTVIKGIEIGVNDYFMIPVENNELKARVTTQLKRKKYIDNLKKDLEKNFNLAIKDSLTNLFNKRYFENHIKSMIDECKNLDKSLILMMIDIDKFKLINDSYGHQFGDEVIQIVADILTKTLRVTDLIARYGGDEFIIAISSINKESELNIAERLRSAVENHKLKIPNQNKMIQLTLSIGVAEYKNQTIEKLIEQADMALYKSKSSGRNKVTIHQNCEQ